MNSKDVAKLLTAIGRTQSKNDKVAMLAKYKDDPTLLMVLTKALDPYLTYGIRVVPKRTIGSDDGMPFNNRVWDILLDLSTRKLSGHNALSVVESALNALDADSARLLTNIIRKDLRAGFGESTVNKAIPKLIPVFPYMRCSLPKDVKLDEWPWGQGTLSQVKADAMFTNVDYAEDQEVRLSSRQGSIYPIEHFPEIVEAVRARLAEGTQSHGEIVVFHRRQMLPRAESNGVMNRIIEGGAFEPDEFPVLYLWDQIPLSSVKPKGVDPRPYSERFRALRDQIEVTEPMDALKMIEYRYVDSLAEATAHFREELLKGYEGTVMKDPRMPWKDGTSKGQVKRKLDADCDLRIKGFNPGEGKNAATFGSVIVESACGQLGVSVSGFTDKMRQYIHEHREALADTIMTVKANAILPPSDSNPLYSLFLPRFVELRKDKSVADDLYQIQKQFEAAIQAV